MTDQSHKQMQPGGQSDDYSALFVLFVLGALTLSHIHQGTLGVDAIRYASIARNILISGKWFPLYDSYAQEVYYNKPPVLFWMVAASFKMLGYSTFSARITGALFTCSGMLLFWSSINRFYGARIALYAIIILAANADFFRSIVDLNFEGILLCGGALLLHAGLSRVRHGRFSGEDRGSIAIGLTLFLIAKPPVLLFILPAYFLIDYSRMSREEIKRRALRRLSSAALLCIAALGIVLLVVPLQMVVHTLSRQLLEPFIFTHSYQDNLSAWIKNIFVFLIPASLVGLAAVLFPLPRERRLVSPAERNFLLLWLMPVVAVVFVAESRTRYLHIPFLALAVLGAEYLTVVWGPAGITWTKRVVHLVVAGMLLAVVCGAQLHDTEPVVRLFQKHPELMDAGPIVCAGGRVDGDIYAPSAKRLDLLIQFTFDRSLKVIPAEKLNEVFDSAGSSLIVANKKCIEAAEDPRRSISVVLEEPGVAVVRSGS